MLQSKGLRFSYPGQSELQFPDINCDGGEAILILGDSGSGKTTLLQLLAGLRSPASGEVRIGETGLSALKAKALDKFRGSSIGLVFQQSFFLQSISAMENLRLARRMAGLKPDDTAIRQLADRLGIADQMKKYPRQMSIGQQQRLGIARALVNEPQVLLADEPTSSLDDRNATEVIGLLQEVCREKLTALVIVTHDSRIRSAISKVVEL